MDTENKEGNRADVGPRNKLELHFSRNECFILFHQQAFCCFSTSTQHIQAADRCMSMFSSCLNRNESNDCINTSTCSTCVCVVAQNILLLLVYF